MFCVKCGVELGRGEQKCPLCGTPVICPPGETNDGSRLYPPEKPQEVLKPHGLLFLLTGTFVLAALICLICDWELNGAVTWCGYSIGGIALFYEWLVLPLWFRRPNPVIFLPCAIVAAGAFAGYVNQATDGDWFLHFDLPITLALALLFGGVTALLRYLPKGKLFVWGGFSVACGGFCVLVETLLSVTFGYAPGLKWSLYPLTALSLIGVMLIVIGLCRPLRESLHRKFFF